MRRSFRRSRGRKGPPKASVPSVPCHAMPCHATPPRERVRDEGDFGMAEASMMALSPGHPAPPPRAIDPPLRPPPFPRRMQQERACSSALAPGSDAMYCIVYYCPRAPSVPCPLASDLLSRCRRLAVAARGLRGRQAHRTAHHCTAISRPRPPGPCTPVVPNSHAVRSLCSFAFPSRRLARCSSPPLHLGLNYSGRRLRLAMSPVCLRRSAAGMDVW